MPGNPPLSVIATWPKPNYKNPDTHPKTILVTACVFGPLTIIIVVARLWVRMRIQRSAGWDDWLMLAAMVPVTILTVIIPLMMESYHLNKHIWDIEPRFFPMQRKFTMAIQSLFAIACGLIKVSILLFYRKLSSRVISRAFRWATWLSIGSIVGYAVTFSLTPVFLCNPISAFWDKNDISKIVAGYKYKCYNEGASVFTSAVVAAVQDLIVATLPTFLYWRLQIPVRQKIALFGVFAVGYGVVAISALRAYSAWRVYFQTWDYTWVSHDIWLWTLLEMHIGAMCANAPSLKAFFRHFFHHGTLTNQFKLRSSSSKQRSGSEIRTKSSTPHSLVSGKLWRWKNSGDYSRSGYLSKPRSDVLVEMHGGVQETVEQCHTSKQRISSQTNDSTTVLSSWYDDDIETGSLKPVKAGERLQALSPVPPQPLATLPAVRLAERGFVQNGLRVFSFSPRTNRNPAGGTWA